MRIAIAGPDGAGKSTVCRVLSSQIRPASLVYAGKREYSFRATYWGIQIWRRARKLGVLPGVLAQYFIFYPLEYLDNLQRFQPGAGSDKTYIFDRHPIDRVILKYELVERYRKGSIGRLRFLLEYLPRTFWGFMYLVFFPRIEQLCVLLPEPELCFERAGGQYRSIEEARIKIDAYRMAVRAYGSRQSLLALDVHSQTTIDDICARIRRVLQPAQSDAGDGHA